MPTFTLKRPEDRGSGLSRSAGLSLVELTAAVAVVGILSAIALPAYQKSVKKAKMAEAELAVTEVVNLEAKRFIETSTYSTDLDVIGYSTTSLKYYTVSVVPGGGTLGSGGVVYRVVASGMTPDLDSVVLTIHEDGRAERWHGPYETAIALGYAPGVAVASAGGASTPGGGGSSPASASPSSSESSSEPLASASSSPSGGSASSSPTSDESGPGESASEASPESRAAAAEPGMATAASTGSAAADSDASTKEKKPKKAKNDPHCFPASNCKDK